MYRQSQILARSGIDIHRSTLADWIGTQRGRRGPGCAGRTAKSGSGRLWHRFGTDRAAPSHGVTSRRVCRRVTALIGGRKFRRNPRSGRCSGHHAAGHARPAALPQGLGGSQTDWGSCSESDPRPCPPRLRPFPSTWNTRGSGRRGDHGSQYIPADTPLAMGLTDTASRHFP